MPDAHGGAGKRLGRGAGAAVAVAQMGTAGQQCLQVRCKQAQEAGELAEGIDVFDLARYVGAFIWGLMVQGASGATKAELRRTVNMALRHMAPDLPRS